MFFFLAKGEYFMKPMLTPDRAYGGKAFRIQPAVGVVDSDGIIAINFIGRAFAFISTGGSPYEKLWHGKTCNINDYCGIESSEYEASAEFIDGVANFQVY